MTTNQRKKSHVSYPQTGIYSANFVEALLTYLGFIFPWDNASLITKDT